MAISFFEVLVYKIRTDSYNNITFLYYFFACPHALGGAGKKVIKKGPSGECFSPLSENIENLCKVVPSSYAATLQIFKCFLIHATAGSHAWNCLRTKYRLTYPEKSRIVSQKQSALARKYAGVRE